MRRVCLLGASLTMTLLLLVINSTERRKDGLPDALGDEFDKLEDYVHSCTDSAQTSIAVSSFFVDDGMVRWFTEYMHTFGICATDRRSLKKTLKEGNGSVYDILSLSDQAYVTLVLANQHEYWTKRHDEAEQATNPYEKSKIMKKPGGRWTDPKLNREGGVFKSGWSKDGMVFYRKLMAFFTKLHATHGDDLRTEAMEWWNECVRAASSDYSVDTGVMNSGLHSVCYSLSGKYRTSKKKNHELDMTEYSEAYDEFDFSMVGLPSLPALPGCAEAEGSVDTLSAMESIDDSTRVGL